MVYRKIWDNCLSYTILPRSAIKSLGRNFPKPTMLRLKEWDLSKPEERLISIDIIDVDLEKIESTAALYFSMIAEDFPDKRYSSLQHNAWWIDHPSKMLQSYKNV